MRPLPAHLPSLLRVVALALLCTAALPALAARAALGAPPPAETLPVVLRHRLSSRHLKAGVQVIAEVSQRVPLSDGSYLPRGAQLIGEVRVPAPHQLSLLWTALRWHAQSTPVHVELVAAAGAFAVEQTRIPLGGPSGRSTSDWTTRQVGGDELIGVNVAATVYNQFSESVARADGTGVYGPAPAAGAPERALGPFSTTARGLYELPGWTVLSAGSASTPILFDVPTGDWQLRAGAAFLLEVVAP